MLSISERPVSIMVGYAIVLHLTWAIIILFDPVAVNATAVAALYRHIQPPIVLACVIASASLLAIAGLYTRVPWIVFLLMPQQILLMMSAAGAVEAIWTAQFADGVIRPRAFIAADQLYSVFAAIGHTIAIIAHARRIFR